MISRMAEEQRAIFANGNRYEGEWQDGKQHRQGTYFFGTGDKYVVGEFKAAQRHGYGILYSFDGDRFEGT